MEFEKQYEASQLCIFKWMIPLISALASLQIGVMWISENYIWPVFWANLYLLTANLIALFFCSRGQIQVVSFLFKFSLGSAFLTVATFFPNPLLLRWVPVVFMVFSLFASRQSFFAYGLVGSLAVNLGLILTRLLHGTPWTDLGLQREVEVAAAFLGPWVAFAFGSIIVWQREALIQALASKMITAKYEYSTLSAEQITQIATSAISFFESSKDYLDPNFKLSRLAQALAIPKHHLSQVLSLGLQRSFYDLLNQYRIKEVVKRLDDQSFDHQTIIEIAYGVGFNSKSTFNAAFKKHMGTTPSAYREGLPRSAGSQAYPSM